MSEIERLLTALQCGDGQFPAGAFAFSWGLESLIADGAVLRADFPAFLLGQLECRWASFDRIVVIRAHEAAWDIGQLCELDDFVDAATTVDAARLGSKRAGSALLSTHHRLGIPSAAAFRQAVTTGRAAGHLAVVQGCVLAGFGLDRTTALTVSAYSTASALSTAAIRLGLIGHLDAQRALLAARPFLSGAIQREDADLDGASSFVPTADIAMMRHALQTQRLFSN
ncbi:urease accessory protein UreF [Labrys portucalensis]|uniref:Urease accessory protein UreF n=1 Tax=Labrys neptuniae TaxID=376174 RepID=A0ABV6ZQC1_9HYPH